MTNIKVLGSGCAKCSATYDLIKTVAVDSGQTVELEKVEDMLEIMSYEIMSTPAVVVDGVVVHRGGVPNKKKILEWITKD